MRTKAEALASPEAGDRWRIGGNNWAFEGCDLRIDRWEGTSGVFSQGGLISQMFLCNWDSDLLAKFNEWAAGAEYLGNEGEQ
ncbi:MAG: hypothetical protein EBR82_22555 [Caulobacteraceae bacterium]|nr:hypothetical protein [Caulobacteraceae bacterium]